MLRTLLLSFLIASTLSACGNKGPLVLPDQPAQKDKDKPAAPAQRATKSGDAAATH